MSTLCLDTSVVARWLLRQARWQVVERLVDTAGVTMVLPGPVITETLVVVRAAGNRSSAPDVVRALTGAGFLIEPPTTEDLVAAAALITLSRSHPGPARAGGRPSTLSLSDSLVLAVTQRLGCAVVSADAYWWWLAERRLVEVAVHRV